MDGFSWALIREQEWFRYVVGILIAFAVFSFLMAFRRFFRGRLLARVEGGLGPDNFLAGLTGKTRTGFLFAISLYCGAHSLGLSPRLERGLDKTLILVFLLQFWFWASYGVNYWVEHYLRKRAALDKNSASTFGLISFAAKAILVVLVLLLALNNLGVNITALIAGLGIGGVAVALALQNILSDLFASLTIVLDKPFEVGDSIGVDDFNGTIEHIGLKTTRIRALTGEQLVFPNSNLLQSRLRNFKRMRERRIALVLAVAYETEPSRLEEVPSIVKTAIGRHAQARFERCHLLRLRDAWLEFEAVYWVTTPDFGTHADIAQAIHLELLREFSVRNINFAYPKPTLLVKSS